MALPYHRIHGCPRARKSNQRPTAHEAQCPSPGTAKAYRSPALRQAEGHTPPSLQMTHNDSLSGASNPLMTQNDSLCHASNPEMTQNDSLCHASMTQMTQNDSHFEVSSFEMTQNDSFSGLKCPTEHPLPVADEPPATPPFPQNDTPDGDPSAAGHPFAAGPLPPGNFACLFDPPSVTSKRRWLHLHSPLPARRRS